MARPSFYRMIKDRNQPAQITEGRPSETCPICDGSGMIDPMLPANDPANEPCPACGGGGVLPGSNEALLTLACLLTGAGGASIDDARVRKLETWLDAQP